MTNAERIEAIDRAIRACEDSPNLPPRLQASVRVACSALRTIASFLRRKD